MTNKLRIAVITHAIDDFQSGYMLQRLLSEWEPRGLEVVVVNDPRAAPVDADLAISHVDMTVVEDDYASLFDHYPLIINSKVRDVSKRVFSDQLLDRDDPYTGPVIVKTNRNFGGMREAQERYLKGDPDLIPDMQRPWRKVDFLPAYPVFNSPHHVPPGVWRNPNLVVEKFRPERTQDDEYSVRMWVFFGDRGIYHQSFSEEPIVKGKNTTRRIVHDVSEVPEAVRRKREDLGFDFGKFDFGIVDGEIVLYDINRTPALPPPGTGARKIMELLPNLSEGLEYFTRKIRQ